jgi:hypothetical protein
VPSPPRDDLRASRRLSARATNQPGRWTWCADCLTVFDDYGTPVNLIPEFTKVHEGRVARIVDERL